MAGSDREIGIGGPMSGKSGISSTLIRKKVRNNQCRVFMSETFTL